MPDFRRTKSHREKLFRPIIPVDIRFQAPKLTRILVTTVNETRSKPYEKTWTLFNSDGLCCGTVRGMGRLLGAGRRSWQSGGSFHPRRCAVLGIGRPMAAVESRPGPQSRFDRPDRQ